MVFKFVILLLNKVIYQRKVLRMLGEIFLKQLQNTGKNALTAQSGSRIGSGSFKAMKDFNRGDVICGSVL